MGKKLTYEFVKDSFEKEGYTLLSKEYTNSSTKLKYMCPKGHKHSVIWSSWYVGTRCPYCSGKGSPSIEFIRIEFKKENYTLLSTKYISNSSKLEYECPNSHKHSIAWYAWVAGKRCPYCARKAKPTLDIVRNSFKLESYTLLSTKYTNSSTKLEYSCPYGHEHSMSWGHWETHRRRCPTCSIISRTGSNNVGWKGGISFEPYCEAWKDKEYKQDIRNRDGNKCLNPYCDSPNKNDLTIHHIDYDKKNCKPSNLITVCRSCNSKANTNRNWHQSWYQTILFKRYNYELK